MCRWIRFIFGRSSRCFPAAVLGAEPRQSHLLTPLSPPALINFSEVYHFLTAVRQHCHNEQSSPDHLCFFSGFLFGDERCASKLSRNRKNSEASIRRFDLNLPVHTARIRDAFWPKLGRLFGISGEPSLLLNPSSSPVSPPATRCNSDRFYRAMWVKEVTSFRDRLLLMYLIVPQRLSRSEHLSAMFDWYCYSKVLTF